VAVADNADGVGALGGEGKRVRSSLPAVSAMLGACRPSWPDPVGTSARGGFGLGGRTTGQLASAQGTVELRGLMVAAPVSGGPGAPTTSSNLRCVAKTAWDPLTAADAHVPAEGHRPLSLLGAGTYKRRVSPCPFGRWLAAHAH
jgi:hypothetical protein